jgi:hypothetical protein
VVILIPHILDVKENFIYFIYFSGKLRVPGMVVGVLLKGVGGLDDTLLIIVSADDLEADGKPPRR